MTVVIDSRMQWLIERAEAGRAEIRAGRFFGALTRATSLTDLSHYLAQLANFSPMFIAALLTRAAVPASHVDGHAYIDAWRRHAADEADHPEMYARWRSAHEVYVGEAPTRETLELGAVCMWSAQREPSPFKVIRLNMAAEGVALDVFSATLAAFERMGVDSGPGGFWRKHRSVDAEHLLIGLDLIPIAEEGTVVGDIYAEVLDHTLEMFGRMLESW